MLNLIKLEIRKFKLYRSIKGAVITPFIILVLLIGMLIVSKNEVDMPFYNFPEFISFIDTTVRSVFIIFSSVILAKITVEEYKHKTINLMFMYPINRKKLFIAKFIIVSVFTFSCIMLSNIFLIFSFGTIDKFIDIVPGAFSIQIFFEGIFRIFIIAISSSCMVFIPLIFGMKKKSTATTIVSSFIVVAIVCSNNNGFSIGSILPVSIGIGIVGILAAGFIIKDLDNLDIV